MEIVQFVAKGLLLAFVCGLAAAVVVVSRAGGSKALENKAVAVNAMHAQVWVAVLSFLGYLAWAQP